MNIKNIVRAYIMHIRPQAQRELDWFRQQPTLSSVIEHAALAQNSEHKRYSHQRRLRRTTLAQARTVLLDNEESIRQCQDFDELFKLLDATLRPIIGIGELYIYDTALRIGAKLNLLPTRVYLHAGTRIGARALGLDHKAKALEMSDLPPALRELEPHEIEDVLCIFKDDLRKASVTDMVRRSWCG